MVSRRDACVRARVFATSCIDDGVEEIISCDDFEKLTGKLRITAAADDSARS